MRKELDQISLDRCSRSEGEEENEYPGLKVRDYYNGKLTLVCDCYAAHEMPNVINENDWVPMITAAALVGISKQAISDRIRRGTLKTTPAKSTRYTYKPDVNLVRLGDCRKRKKAGRPVTGKLNTPKCCQPVKGFSGHQTDISDFCDAGSAELPWCSCGNCNSQTPEKTCFLSGNSAPDTHRCKKFMHWDPAKRFENQI